MVKYSTAILLFAVAVFWPSVSARSIHGHYQEPHHGISVENDDVIEDFLKWAFEEVDEISNSAMRDGVLNILHGAKHRRWRSFDEFATYLRSALTEYKKDLKESYSRNRRSVDSDSDESTDEFENMIADRIARVFVLSMLIGVAPDEYRSTLIQKFEDFINMEFNNEDDFINETARVFKEVTGDDVEKYVDQFNPALESSLKDFTEE